MSVINTATNTAIETVGVGAQPAGIAITPAQITLSLTVFGHGGKKDVFLTETDLFNVITWTPPAIFIPMRYKIYRDGVLIAILPATDPRRYEDHNRKENRVYTYFVVAEDDTGAQAAGSISIKTTH